MIYLLLYIYKLIGYIYIVYIFIARKPYLFAIFAIYIYIEKILDH